MAKVIAFSGLSNSGKTTLIEKLVLMIRAQNKSVLVIKHDPKDKASFDVRGKDSDRFFRSGADVCVISPTRSTFFVRETQEEQERLQAICNQFKDKDYIFIEGFRHYPFQRIIVARGEIGEGYSGDAFALKDIEDSPRHGVILDLDCPQMILEWIEKN